MLVTAATGIAWNPAMGTYALTVISCNLRIR